MVVVGAGDGLTVVVAGLGVVAVASGEVVACVVLAEAWAEAVPVWLAEAPALAEPDADDVAVDDPDGEKIAGTLDDGEPVQAERVAERMTVKVAPLRTASRGLLAGPAKLMPTFMNPP